MDKYHKIESKSSKGAIQHDYVSMEKGPKKLPMIHGKETTDGKKCNADKKINKKNKEKSTVKCFGFCRCC